MNETKVTNDHLLKAIDALDSALRSAMASKGDKAFASPHEALGALTEEYHELIEAVRANDAEAVRGELLDNAIVAIWAVASTFARSEQEKKI